MERCLPKYLQTKLLIVSSLLIIISGFSFLWFGLKQQTDQPTLVPTVVSETPPATSSATFGIEGEQVLVLEVVDGDTIKIEGNITLRLIGIDTPETKHPRKSVECFGKEAAFETRSLLEGREVILQKDVSEKDKYGRLLRYVFLPMDPSTLRQAQGSGQLLFVNDYLIREGFARALTYPPDVKYTEQFLEAQKEAKELRKGLWIKC